MTYQIDQMKLVFWKMFVNDNTILYPLSRLIRDRFAAVASKYGTLSLAQSVSNTKQVVWNSFITNVRFLFLYCILSCILLLRFYVYFIIIIIIITKEQD